MAAIPLNQLGNVWAVPSPPWARKPLTIRTLRYPKGVTPAHLERYQDRFAQAARQCASRTADLRGRAARVSAMNACVREALKGKA